MDQMKVKLLVDQPALNYHTIDRAMRQAVESALVSRIIGWGGGGGGGALYVQASAPAYNPRNQS